jgi:hypothetical protein
VRIFFFLLTGFVGCVLNGLREVLDFVQDEGNFFARDRFFGRREGSSHDLAGLSRVVTLANFFLLPSPQFFCIILGLRPIFFFRPGPSPVFSIIFRRHVGFGDQLLPHPYQRSHVKK